MKKLKVNAQVTAINTIVEMTGSITYTIILAIMKGNTFNSFIYQQFFYNILLPFSFLSNTSDNKTRIVEVGWNNVIRNIIGNMKNQIYVNLKTMAEILPVTCTGTNEKRMFNSRVSKVAIIDNDCQQNIKSKNEVIITRVIQNEMTTKTTNELNVPKYEDEQSQSK